MSLRVVVFAGAGASKAVDPENYPTTVDFFERLPESIRNNQVFVRLLEFLRGRGRSDSHVDIEVVLWHLSELRDQLTAITRSDQFLGWLFDGDRLQAIANSGGHIGQARNAAAGSLPRIRGVIDDINRQVFHLYRRQPEKSELAKNWTPLLSGLLERQWEIELVTTNYDVVLEHALAEVEYFSPLIPDRGWGSDVFRALELDRWAREPFSTDAAQPSRGLLTKLHGSVNWSREEQRIYVGDPGFKGTDDRHAIVYPGFKGRPSIEPFLTMHQYFGRALSLSTAAVFIGFAFRDEYINEICERFVGDRTKVFVINPNSLTRLPFPSQSLEPQILSGFDEESIKKVLSRLDEIASKSSDREA